MSPQARLVRPDIAYKQSFLEAYKEFQQDGHHRYQEFHPEALEAEFAAFVQRELAREHTTAPGKVSDSVYWLVDDAGFIGRIALRHELNDFLRRFGGHIGYEIRPSRRQQGYGRLQLALLLPIARARGMDRLMITCDVSNTGSARIIEQNGGVLQDIVEDPTIQPEPYMRWWIDLSAIPSEPS